MSATIMAAPATAAPTDPPLRLIAGAPAVTVDRYGQDPQVYLDLGTHMVTGKNAFEVRTSRKSYHDPVVATQVIRQGSTVRNKPLPAGLVTDFTGLTKFFHLTVTDTTGKKVIDRDQTFCPNSYDASRARPDAPDKSAYPNACGYNPFTRGAIGGIQAGWQTSTSDYFGQADTLPDGRYTAKLAISKAYQDAFGIPADASSATVAVTVRTITDPMPPGHGKAKKKPPATALAAGPRPTGTPNVPAGPKPDLRPLPAWGIGIAPTGGKDYLQFAANVWNAGPSPLVVDGFRQSGKDLMDAYQYFYDANGKQIGYAPTGTMEWDAREGHNHWHFTDFASYRLLKADQTEAVRSQKEAFCLANTDAIDYLVKNANWKPGNTDLHTACGTHTSLSVREVLDVGSGDTYVQTLPGQSFDVSDLPNGTYYIQVLANPENKLYETDTKNNSALRKVVLGGTTGARTVTVPPYELVDAP